MSSAIVAGIGEFHPVRRSEVPVEAMVLSAIAQAIADAGLTPPDIGAVVTESSLTPRLAPIDRIASCAGLHELHRVMQSSPVGAGILASVGIAADLVESGEVDHCLVYFGIDWGATPDAPTDYHERMPAKRVVEFPAGFAGPAVYFAAAARRYQHLHALSDAVMQDLLWSIVDATRQNAAQHPHAQRGRPLRRDQYLAEPMQAEPLRSADCALLSDGAIALVVSRGERVRSGHARVRLAAWAYEADPIPDLDFYTQSPTWPALPNAARCSAKAYRAAALDRLDLSLLLLYDCFSIAVALQLEAIGACRPGGAGELCAGGSLRFDGACPTNTHGGLLAHGYLVGAGHVVEAVHQLRHEAGARQVRDARHAFVGAGPGRQYTSLIFSREGG